MYMSEFPSKTFCALPWMHLSTRPNGHVRVCCTANASGVQNAESTNKTASEVGVVKRDDGKPANLNTTSLAESWNNIYMKETRKMMMRGEQPQSCLKCFKEEEAGHRSKRIWETEKWIREIGVDEILEGYNHETGEAPPIVRYVDLRLGSKCQLACVMCSPHDSSNWIPEHKLIYPKIQNKSLKDSMQWEKDSGKLTWSGGSYNWHKNNPMFFDELYQSIPYLKQLYFAGGEPLIHDEHYELLQKVIDDGYANQIELRYNSNGMEWREDLFELWKHFKVVIFHFSIDDIGERLHYIRYPAKFEHLEEMIWKLDDYPYDNLKLTTAYTVMALNIYYISDFIKWKLKSKFKKLNEWPNGAGLWSCHLAYWPPQLNVKVLPEWFKEEVEVELLDLCHWLEDNWELSGAPDKKSFMDSEYGIKRIKGLISFMKAEDWSNRLPETAEWCYRVAKERGIDFNASFPELDWLEWYYLQ